MKTLANCEPREFLKQTAKIRHKVSEWLDMTKVLEIRKTAPKFPDGSTEEEKQNLIQEQTRKNLSKMLDAILDEHPDETLDLLGLMCFIEPDEIDNYSTDFYFDAIAELLSNKAIIRFFASLVQLEQINTSKGSKV